MLFSYSSKKWIRPAASMAVIVFSPAMSSTLAAAELDQSGVGLTKGPLDGKRSHEAVQLVGKRGHILIAEKAEVKNQWTFKDGVLTASPMWDSLVTPNTYQDFKMHVEFNVNNVPGVDPEKNGNSGIYIQQRYELQILNSHGIAPEDYKASYAGSLYKQKKPDKLVSKPAGEWQTYDIIFRAARFEEDKKVASARISVKHNGVLIHDDYALTNKTGAGKKEGAEPFPIKFQGHKNMVKFRNVWIQRLELEPKPPKKAEPKKKGYTYVIPFAEAPPAPALGPKDALKSFRLHEDFEISTVVNEPEVQNPLALRFDGNGRMWVVEMRAYMPDANGTGEEEPIGRISIHEDTDNDGVYDKTSVFLDGLNQPRSIALYKNGILYGGHEKLYFVENVNGKAGKMTVIDENYTDNANVEHRTNGLFRGLDNWIYNAKSDVRYREIDGKWVKQKTSFRGQWGINHDNYGRLYYNENWFGVKADQLMPNTLMRNPNYLLNRNHATQISYRDKLFPARITLGANRGGEGDVNKDGHLRAATGAAGAMAYRGDQFPAKYQDIALFSEPVANLVRMVHMSRKDGLTSGEHLFGEKEFLASTDERFRPVNIFNAPDGTLYLTDMYHGIIQHKHYLTKYLREYITHQNLETHPRLGRIYRIKYRGNPRGPKPTMIDKKALEIVPHLAHPNGWWRDTAQQLIIDSGDASVIPALNALASDASKPLGQIHALWTLEGLGKVNLAAIIGALKSNDSYVLESAIRLTEQLPEIEAFAILSTLSELVSKSDIIVERQLAASLGQIPSEDALTLLKKVLTKNIDAPYFREAAISGLNGREKEFKDLLGDNFKDAKFIKYLEHCLTPKTTAASYKPPRNKAHRESYQKGEKFYIANCMACHGNDGNGLEHLGPPLVKSEWVMNSPEKLSAILLQGLIGPITVNGKKYTPAAAMPGLKDAPQITDADLADVSTFIRHAWNNRKSAVDAATILKVRKQFKDRQTAFTPEELNKIFP
ncbi:MAG: mono/diheme cytochrome c family protein/glucose/arabinose dehydrogenase [Cryomorphaceae bacterium]|jgi:mono/diheme cytochrome c family protein/glucose/arabinose dehydrogenase